MAIILANDGIEKQAEETLGKLGHEVDTRKVTGDALLARLAEVDAVVVRSATTLGRAEIEAGASGRLRLIVRAGVGLDNIDSRAAEQHGLLVRNTPTASSNAVAELAFAHMLTLARHLHEANVTMRQGQWLKKAYGGRELAGKTLGLVGYGRIARDLAKKALAFGMEVIFNVRTPGVEGAGARQVSFDELLAQADFVSLHLPSTGQSLFTAATFQKMKPGAFLINTARGDLVDEDALLEALASGHLAGAGLDVFRQEPLTEERLMNCQKLSLTPHLGASTAEAQARIGDVIVDIVREVFS